jgi:hypothetical protein
METDSFKTTERGGSAGAAPGEMKIIAICITMSSDFISVQIIYSANKLVYQKFLSGICDGFS